MEEEEKFMKNRQHISWIEERNDTKSVLSYPIPTGSFKSETRIMAGSGGVDAFYVSVSMNEWSDIHFFYYVSSHKIQNQYNNTGATSDKLESNIDGANNHEPESKNENKKMIQRTQERLGQHRLSAGAKTLTA